jgi:hypothetical protein
MDTPILEEATIRYSEWIILDRRYSAFWAWFALPVTRRIKLRSAQGIAASHVLLITTVIKPSVRKGSWVQGSWNWR